jgi:hypothetical protein
VMLKKQNKTYKNSSERLTADCKRYPESGLVHWRLAPVRCEAAIRPKAGPKQKCLSHARIDVADPTSTCIVATKTWVGRYSLRLS